MLMVPRLMAETSSGPSFLRAIMAVTPGVFGEGRRVVEPASDVNRAAAHAAKCDLMLRQIRTALACTQVPGFPPGRGISGKACIPPGRSSQVCLLVVNTDCSGRGKEGSPKAPTATPIS